jgi:hypothetical protein
MGEDTTQPTPIAEEEYKQFRAFVQDVHGQTRGHLRTEIENALREYRESYYGGDRLMRIEDDLATIKASIVEAESDGGAAVAAPSEADSAPAPETKPAANQSRQKKVEYLMGEMGLDKSGGSMHEDAIREVVTSEYSFTDNVVAEYKEAIIARLDAIPDPEIDGMYIWGEEEDERYAKVEEDVDSELDRVSNDE